MSQGGFTRWAGIVAAPAVKLSTVPKLSFLDLGAVRNLAQYADGEHVVWLTDPAGKIAQLNIDSRRATGETLSPTESNPNPTFDVNTASWLGYQGSIASINGGQSGKCLELTRSSGAYQTAYIPNTIIMAIAGALYKFTPYVKSGTSLDEAYYIRMQSGGGTFFGTTSGMSSASWVQAVLYGTTLDATLVPSLAKNTATPGTMLFDEASIKQVLSPALTGAWAIRRRDGQAAFECINAGFAYNAASYRVEIAYQPRAARTWSIPGVSPNLLYPGRPMGRKFYIPVSLSQSDALTVAAAEGTTGLQGSLSRADGLSVGVTEGTTGLAAFLSRADTLGLTVSETAAVLAVLLLINLSDTLGVGITEGTTAADVVLQRADALGITVQGVVDIAAFFSLADTLGIKVSDYLAGAVLGVPVSPFALVEMPPRYALEEQPARFALEEQP